MGGLLSVDSRPVNAGEHSHESRINDHVEAAFVGVQSGLAGDVAYNHVTHVLFPGVLDMNELGFAAAFDNHDALLSRT